MTNLTINFSGTFSTKFDHALKPDPILLKDLTIGYNYVDRFIIYVNSKNNIEWVISRLCDHANGTLQPCENNNQAECPLHGWKLDLTTLRYNNVNVQKETVDFHIENDELIINYNKAYLQFPEQHRKKPSNQDFSIRFLAHASLLIKCGNTTMITDPWLQGPCFLNGWWHKPCPSEDAIQQLLAADLIYISHNHADHMHIETLEILNKKRPDIPIITPNFKSKSTERPLKNMGFTNIHTLTFNQLFEIGNEGLHVSILKSGDFRDDSGLYVHFNNKQLLATVDSSNLNQLVLPQHLDLLTTSYAAGASGHPWCFDHYNHEQKCNITKKRHASVKNAISDYVKACKPKAYMPYAGYFEESASRDHYIRDNNQKIKPNDIRELVHQIDNKITFIDPTLNDQIFIADSIHAKPSGITRETHYNQDYIDSYISKELFSNENDFNSKIHTYFENTQFNDDLILYLVPCDDYFNYLSNATSIDFSSESINMRTYMSEEDIYINYEQTTYNIRKLLLRVRAAQLWDVICNMKSWEELSIGFHCRIHRNPDVYNSDFWYYFSNCYVE